MVNPRDCSQAWANTVSGGVNYAQAAKVYMANGAAIVISPTSTTGHTSHTTTSKAPTLTLASTSGTLANPGKLVTSCPAGCVPISYSTTISIKQTPTMSTPSSTPAAGCPVAGRSCSAGAMACSGYYYGQCANGVWVMRKCADGLACFSSGGTVYCDWASNGVITDCSGSSSSKVKRDEEYGVAFVGGSGDASDSASSSSESPSPSTESIATAVENVVSTSSTEDAVSESYVVATTDVTTTVDTDTTVSVFTTVATAISADSDPIYTTDSATEVSSSTSETDGTSTTSTTSAPTSTDSLDSLEISALPYIYNSSTISPISFKNVTYSNTSSTTSDTSTSDSPISDVTSTGLTPPTNVTLSIQPLNTTHFVAVLQASTLNNTPILTDWSFSFNSDYRILGADRGNLTNNGGSYTITSIPIQEPDRNMAVVVRLWGVYDSNTAEGMVGVNGVGGVMNGSYAMIKRAIRMGFGF